MDFFAETRQESYSIQSGYLHLMKQDMELDKNAR